MPSAIPYSPTGFYWNTRGNIRCEQHTQEIEQIRWDAEGWGPIPETDEHSRPHYQCQKCRPDGNPPGHAES